MSDKRVFKSEDPKFVRFITTLYSYVYPFASAVMTLILLFNGAIASSLCFFLIFLLVLPQMKERLEKIKIRGILKLIICLVLIWLGLYCTIFKI